MTRVLVVHHDVDAADLEVEALRHAGYEVQQCGGPTHALTACPVLHGAPCWQVDWADVVVYDAWAAGSGSATLTEDIRQVYPTKPIILTSSGMGLTWEAEVDEWTTAIDGPATRARLSEAIEAAMTKPQTPVR